MSQLISITGYAPKIDYCPRCGSGEIYQSNGEGAIKCENCGLECYIVEGDNSEDFKNE